MKITLDTTAPLTELDRTIVRIIARNLLPEFQTEEPAAEEPAAEEPAAEEPAAEEPAAEEPAAEEPAEELARHTVADAIEQAQTLVDAGHLSVVKDALVPFGVKRVSLLAPDDVEAFLTALRESDPR